MGTIKDSLDRFITGIWFFPYLKKAKTEDAASPIGVTNKGRLVKLDASSSEGPQGPAGKDGQSASITSATATALAAGATPTVTLGGTPLARTFAFGIPKGDKGDKGDTGAQGAPGTNGTNGTNATLPATTEGQFLVKRAGVLVGAKIVPSDIGAAPDRIPVGDIDGGWYSRAVSSGNEEGIIAVWTTGGNLRVGSATSDSHAVSRAYLRTYVPQPPTTGNHVLEVVAGVPTWVAKV